MQTENILACHFAWHQLVPSTHHSENTCSLMFILWQHSRAALQPTKDIVAVYPMIGNAAKAAIYVHGQWTMCPNLKITRKRTLRGSLLPKRHEIFGIITKSLHRLDPSGCLCPPACAINGGWHISAIYSRWVGMAHQFIEGVYNSVLVVRLGLL